MLQPELTGVLQWHHPGCLGEELLLSSSPSVEKLEQVFSSVWGEEGLLCGLLPSGS